MHLSSFEYVLLAVKLCMHIKPISIKSFEVFVKPWPQTLSPKTPKPKTKGPWADTKISWATTPPQPITFKHEGGVPQKNSKSKKGLEWSPLLVQQKKPHADSERKDME